MPKKKQEEKRDIFHYRIFTRPNLGSRALTVKRAPDTEYIGTRSSVKYAQEWIKENGDKKNVYLIEKYNAKTHTQSTFKMPRVCYCYVCGLYSPEQRRTFVEKWAWNERQGWHPTGFTLASEVASIKCVNNKES